MTDDNYTDDDPRLHDEGTRQEDARIDALIAEDARFWRRLRWVALIVAALVIGAVLL